MIGHSVKWTQYSKGVTVCVYAGACVLPRQKYPTYFYEDA